MLAAEGSSTLIPIRMNSGVSLGTVADQGRGIVLLHCRVAAQVRGAIVRVLVEVLDAPGAAKRARTLECRIASSWTSRGPSVY